MTAVAQLGRLTLLLLWTHSPVLHAQYGLEAAPETNRAATPTGPLNAHPGSADPNRRPPVDLFEETVGKLAPIQTSRTDSSQPPTANGASTGIYGLGDGAAAEVPAPSRQVPESLAENVPKSFSGNGDGVKIAGDLATQYNLPQTRTGMAAPGSVSAQTLAALLGVVALAAWYAFQITKQEPEGRRHRHRRSH